MTKHLTLSQLLASGVVIPTISYRRVSSERQLSGEGLERQRKSALEWIAKHPELNLRLDSELEDAARSAWKGHHVKDGSALGSLLKQVDQGILQPPLMIIVEALDRLSRQDTSVAQEQFTGLINRGIHIATTLDNQIYGPGLGLDKLILSLVKMEGAHAESEAKSERVHKTKLAHVETAIAAAQAGKQPDVIHQNVPAWCEVREKITKANRSERTCELRDGPPATVLLIYQMALHRGSDSITRWLIAHQDKHPAFGRTGKWSLRAVKKLLRSRAPIGCLESKHGIIHNAYPRVPGLTDELWLAVQAAQDARVQAGSTAWKSDRINLLKGVGKCATCDGPMRLQPTERGVSYYQCRDRRLLGQSHCANACNYRCDLIETAMLDQFGLGWLESEPAAKAPADLGALEAEHAKLVKREKFLTGKLQEVEDNNEYDLVMGQLRELRGKVNDAATRLNAARQQDAVAKTSVKITDLKDRAELATALRRLLNSVRFGGDNRVTMESDRYVLTVCARQDGPKPALTIKTAPIRQAPIHVKARPAIRRQ